MKITPELMVDDLNTSLDFYREQLGFLTVTLFPEEKPVFAIIHHDQAEIMLYHRKEFAQEIPAFKNMTLGGSFVLYLEVNDIDELYQKLQSVSTIIQPPHTTTYGTLEFSCTDPNGYVLMLAQKLEK